MAQTRDGIVFIVDDDPRVREALSLLLASFDMQAVSFASAAEYLRRPKIDMAACLVLDIELPDINGLDLQTSLKAGEDPHVVFITGHGDIPSTVRAMKSGAVDFLTKPFKEADVIRAINAALAQNREARSRHAELGSLRRRYSKLTSRERDVLPLVVSGLLNKQAAAELGISEITVKAHRGRVMRKMAAASLAELVTLALRLDLAPAANAAANAAAPPAIARTPYDSMTWLARRGACIPCPTVSDGAALVTDGEWTRSRRAVAPQAVA